MAVEEQVAFTILLDPQRVAGLHGAYVLVNAALRRLAPRVALRYAVYL